jgi:translation initiation factor 6
MDIIKYDVYRGPNLGIYISVNDATVLLPMGFAQSKAEKLAKYLDVKYLYTSIANTRLIGALSVMNNKGILLPKTAYQNEFDFLKEETGLEVGVLDSKFTALGNVICANDKGAVVSPWLSDQDCETISDVLGVETIQKRIAGFNQTGVVMVANNTGAAIHPEADEEDMKTFANLLGVKVEQSSINNGIPYVSSGILANNNAIVVGSLTTGPEIMMLTRAFLN